MKMTPLESRISQIISPVVTGQGLRLVNVKIIGEGGGRNIQVMAEDPATRNIGIDECASLSRAISVALDVENPIDGAYRLEVSSPGIDRPLITLQDYQDYIGFEAKLETDMPNENGQKRFRGFIEGIEGDVIALKMDTGRAEIPHGAVIKSKLVLNDQLIKAKAKTNTNQERN
jgi:ribosome maturation factor RimP